jgi:MFS family permease
METIDPLAGDAHRHEGGEQGRLDRELLELLNELRVVLPGVQALFAFLLIVPFNDRFADVTGRERAVYIVALLASALACVLFIAAPAFHRLRFRRHDKAQLLRVGNRCAIAGMAALAVAMIASVFLVAEVIFGAGVAIALAALVAVPMAVLWWVVPVVFGPHRT